MLARSFVSRHFGGPQKMAVFVVLELGRRDNRVKDLLNKIGSGNQENEMIELIAVL